MENNVEQNKPSTYWHNRGHYIKCRNNAGWCNKKTDSIVYEGEGVSVKEKNNVFGGKGTRIDEKANVA